MFNPEVKCVASITSIGKKWAYLHAKGNPGFLAKMPADRLGVKPADVKIEKDLFWVTGDVVFQGGRFSSITITPKENAIRYIED